jgi:2-polyprenyl-6-hydroxyphenyl methylase / 3-demethylubiquinone-9 3-methyltransferase
MFRKDQKRSLPIAAGSTVDPAEIARFNAMADEWWKPDGAFKLVHAFNGARVAHISERIANLCARTISQHQPLAGLKIIDVGCGPGLVSETLSFQGAEVLGIDAAERNVAVAQHHATLTGAPVTYRHALPEDCADLTGRFDVVMSLEVVEHVANRPQFLAALTRLLKPGGVLVIGTLNRTLRSYLKVIIGAEYILGWLPKGTHDWAKFVRPDELVTEIGMHGLSVVERSGVELNPLTMRWRIGNDLSTNYLQFHRQM